MKPGVYIDLPFEEYLAADAIGQSDLKVLLRTPADWWYNSKHNPDRIHPAREKHFILGEALHTTLLETPDDYEARFSVEPDGRFYADAARTVAEIKAILDDADIPYDKGMKKAELVTIAEDNDLGHQVWDSIRARHLAEVEAGKSPLSWSEDNALRHMGELARSHPQIGPALSVALSEVSVFWEEGGILFRARFDKIAPAWTMDLKSFSGWQGRDPRDAALRQIVEHEYDIQATHYHDAREHLRKFVVANQVHVRGCGWGVEYMRAADYEKLISISEVDTWQWLWLFYQLRTDIGSRPKAPALIPRFYRPSSKEEQYAALEEGAFDMMAQARAKIDRAIENYNKFIAQVGTDEPWTDIHPIHEILDEDLAAAGLQYKGVPRA